MLCLVLWLNIVSDVMSDDTSDDMYDSTSDIMSDIVSEIMSDMVSYVMSDISVWHNILYYSQNTKMINRI